MAHCMCEEQSHIPLSKCDCGGGAAGGVPLWRTDKWVLSTELLQPLRGTRQSPGFLQESPLMFALTLKKLLQVKSQELPALPLQATVLPNPLGEARPPPVRK